jgi:hypothetical protein
MAGTEFKVDTKELEQVARLFKMAPKQLQHTVNRYIHDEVYNFKKFAVDIIADTYTIRDRKFVEGAAWDIKISKASAPVDGQFGEVSSRRIEDGKSGLFTGWSEEIDGKPQEMRNKFGRGSYRTIGPNAREGGEMEGKVLGQYRLRMGGIGYNSDRIPDSSQYGLPMSQFLAMVMKSDATGRSKRAKHFKTKDYAIGKNKVFIMEREPRYKRGLYTFINGKLKILQRFFEQPVKPRYDKFDWQGDAIYMVNDKFTPAYVWERYVAPMINALFEKK